MKKIRLFNILLLLTMISAGIFTVPAQIGETDERDKNLLVERVAKAVKEKDKVKIKSKVTFRENKNYTDSVMKLIRGNTGAEIRVFEFGDTNSAVQFIKDAYLNAVLAVTIKYTRLTNLGDEAYLRTSPASPYKQIIFRLGSNVISIDSSRIDVARYYTKYFVEEAAKREKGL